MAADGKKQLSEEAKSFIKNVEGFDFIRLSIPDVNGMHLSKLVPKRLAGKIASGDCELYSGTIAFGPRFEDSYWPVLTHSLAVFLVGACIFGGIKWIEKANMILVPMLLGILIFTFGWSLTRKYSEVGITFLFTPYWGSMFSPSLWVAAASQNAFDTGAAMALFISYSAYFNRKNGSVRLGTMIPMGNNMVSLLCALTIFSTVFSTLIQNSPTLTRSGIVKIMQSNGPGSTGLTFTWIPVLFAYVGGFGRVLCSLFFLCLSFAGITSLIGHVQLTVITAKDLGLSHRQAAFAGLFLTLIFGLPSAFSINVLTNQDNVWGFALMLSGLAMAGLVLIYGPMKYRKVIVNDFGIGDWTLPIVWVFMIRCLCSTVSAVYCDFIFKTRCPLLS
ncbi:unnamed protein product [Trichobilharzia regenti]|nr:unnamed protein product [Trichobilharzia regenti]